MCLPRLTATMNLRRDLARVAMALVLLALAGCGGDPAVPARSGEPDQSVSPADLAVVGATALSPAELSGVGLPLEPLPAGAELVGAHYAIALAGVAVTDQLTHEQLDALLLDIQFEAAGTAPLRAGQGREFLVVPLAAPESARTVLGGDAAEVIVDGESRPLDRVPHEQEVLVVNVPAGGDATLAITDAGETRSISLRTGERDAGGDPAADALAGGSVQLEEGVEISGVTPEGRYDGLTIRVTLQPSAHVDGEGRAPDGRMWLEIEFGLTYAGLVAERAELELDLAESLTIVGSDGTRVPVPGDTVEPTVTPDGGLAIADWSGVVDVADSLRAFEVSYATNGRFTAPDGSELAFTRYEVTSTGTIELTER
jgi:hypothetical protein